ncbi:alkaline phosphatase D family protein [Sinimarinibacterium flocculans]|uniref:Alkaline phosphatase D n=1 Tax=Sinimarinibacterium flocculans TaxID=985250 RepID=A0A318E0R8_9GAMM|nr:alkaline phosphatase D family protein [Sinimarinibacterium flocculans]PXV64284.1 alkaline phosphatase D [Sinimarinibacterium flocculans]
MSPPIDRRKFLRGSAALGAFAALGGLGACGDSGPAAADGGAAVDLVPPPGWDYPAINELLPFGHGVASGDPLADRVILWTRITVPDARGWAVADPQGLTEVAVDWLVATDPALDDIVARGRVRTDRGLDWTVKVDAAGLPSATTYYYAFEALGRRSITGRTRTAPAPGDAVAELRIAHAACSSYWSMDFHPYARIAERDDLDLFCHAGDHVYDFVDDKQWYRARNDVFDPEYVDFRDWRNADECGRRYALYYSDPDLLKAHQSLPFAIMPDQHDVDDATDPDTGIEFTRAEAAQVFWLWTPSRPPLPDGSGEFGPPPTPDTNIAFVPRTAAELFYRYLPYGDLADVILIDQRRHRDPQAPSEMGKLLGQAQTAWLQRVLLASTNERGAVQRVVVNQINLSQLLLFTAPLPGLFETLGLNPNGPELYTSGWGGFPAARDEFYGFLREHGIVDNLVMSGDSHGWFANDLIETAGLPAYNPANGGGTRGVVGVEIVPSAMGRANGVDVVAGALYAAAHGGQPPLADYATQANVYVPLATPIMVLVEDAARLVNPQLRYFNWRTYGYGLAHLTADTLVCELWEVPSPQAAPEQTLLRQFVSAVGAPHLASVPNPQPTRGGRQSPAAPLPAGV